MISLVKFSIGPSVVDPWHFSTDPDEDPQIRTSVLRIRMRIQEAQKHTDSTDPDPEHWYKVIKMSQNSRNQGFSFYICLMKEGSGAGSGVGSVLVTNGSGCGSGRPKNIGTDLTDPDTQHWLDHYAHPITYLAEEDSDEEEGEEEPVVPEEEEEVEQLRTPENPIVKGVKSLGDAVVAAIR